MCRYVNCWSTSHSGSGTQSFGSMFYDLFLFGMSTIPNLLDLLTQDSEEYFLSLFLRPTMNTLLHAAFFSSRR